jgi:hypothetical protein
VLVISKLAALPRSGDAGLLAKDVPGSSQSRSWVLVEAVGESVTPEVSCPLTWGEFIVFTKPVSAESCTNLAIETKS